MHLSNAIAKAVAASRAPLVPALAGEEMHPNQQPTRVSMSAVKVKKSRA